ncbi:MAG: hypothetical protein GTO46_00015, partial [Gemmatimonadetes bacterium]|nr:hypothetical protein [Gemmatimonadota bacterium]
AEEETRRAEAQKLLALGQIRFETHHSEALAWARASLEAMDTPDGRDFALRALSRGPVARWLTPRKEAGPDAGVVHAVSFSPDGAW